MTTATPPIQRHDDGVIAIDTMTGGLQSVTAGYLLAAERPALVETGPALGIESLLAGLDELGVEPGELAYVVLTHIHLDHAGGAGDVAAAFPEATIVVSELGAQHLHDPDRLNAAARTVYGDLHDTVYGDCTPIEAERILAVGDGDVLGLGGGRELQVQYAPGHAKHHIGIFDTGTGALFSGDSVGVRLPGMATIRPATPPTDFHLDAALATLERYRRTEPDRVYLAHYGPVDPPDEALVEAEERLRLWAATAEAAWEEARRGDETAAPRPSTELDHVTDVLRQRFTDELPAPDPDDPDRSARLELLSGVESNAAGLVRWLRRRADGSLTPVG